MNLLAIDVGNTRVKVGVFDADGRVSLHATETDAVSEAAVLSEWLQVTVGEMPDTILVSSVVRGFGDLLRQVQPSREVILATPEMNVGVDPDLPDPASVGIDRLLAAGEAYTRVESALTLVTLGTAITIDSVTENGRFAGGAILPGLRAAATSLHTQTSLLPEVEPAPPEVTPPVTTRDSIRAGLVLGTAGAVDRIVGQCWAGPGGRRILTGGDATIVSSYLDGEYEVMEDLVLHGLVSTWRRERG